MAAIPSLGITGMKTPKNGKMLGPDFVLEGSLAVIAVILAAGLIFSFTASANTFKLEHHNKVQLNQRIENQNMSPSMGEIVDRTKKSEMTEEERAARFKEITRY